MMTEKYITDLCKTFYDFKYSLFKVIESMCKEEGLTALQSMMLFLLKTEGSATVGELSGYFNITQSNVSTMCKKLEKDGLLQRTRSKTDERTVLLTVTDKGIEALERMLKRGERFGQVLSEIPNERLDLILATVNDATDLLKKMHNS